MKKTVIILSVLALLLVLAYFFLCSGTKHYTYPLNTIEAIRYYEPADKQYAYRAVTLTPTKYRRTPFTNTLTVKAIYKGETIGIKIETTRKGNEITLKSIGKESDNFVKAIAELYDENANQNTTMRHEIKGVYWNGEAGFLNWHIADDYYKIGASTLNGKEAAMYLDIMIPADHIVTIGDKNSGLSKKQFVDVFRENVK